MLTVKFWFLGLNLNKNSFSHLSVDILSFEFCKATELLGYVVPILTIFSHFTLQTSTRQEKSVGMQAVLEKSDTVKKPEPTKSKSSVEPIQLPPSFKDAFNFKGMNSSDMKLEFTFDAELAKLTEEKVDNDKDVGLDAPRPIPLPDQSR